MERDWTHKAGYVVAVHEALMKFAAPALELVVLAEAAALAMYKIESISDKKLDFAMFKTRRLDLFWFGEWLGEKVLKEWREGLNL